ncbi:MAG: transposase [Gemmataceae bacterium]|nr:transposase [Gemmataceae bacterium]MCI0741368.1 transposase [Gemmataceae bacterium]
MENPLWPLAYHITWTMYGTWLPGDSRGWIKAGEWGIQPPDAELERHARERMVETAVVLDSEQRALVEQTIRDHCTNRSWHLHAVNVRTTHVHVVISAECDADDIMNQFKAWCSRKLSDQAGLTTKVAEKAGRRHWFTEGGDKNKIENEQYLDNAIRYVVELQ